MNLSKKIKALFQFEAYIDKVQRNNYDALASTLLHRMFPDYTILPFSPFSLNPNTILHLVNDIQINNRNHVLEFGSGVSTLILARYIQQHNLNTKITSIDNNPEWSAFISKELDKYKCHKSVTLITAPLSKLQTTAISNNWYAQEPIKKALRANKFDLVIVDGPSGSSGKKARYPALPLVLEYLHPNFIIFLDDTRRKDEQAILKDWEQLLLNAKINIEIDNDSKKVYATIKSKGGFSTKPMSY